MNSLVIAAIPAEDEYVWQVSSEKVPHLTLLYLGDAADKDADDYDQMVAFVEHAASLINPFYMDVDYRGTLGADNADVIFFEKGWDYKKVAAFRESLLTNSAIKREFASVDQFPEWTPHLTLGYPTSPAKKPDHDHPIYAVRFDRIAVWLGEYEGPEFRLKRDDLSALSDGDGSYLSMTMNEAKSILHYGVKGMKWGVRREKGSGHDQALRPTVGGIKAQVKKVQDKQNKSLGPKTPVVAKISTNPKTGKAQIKTEGGDRHPAHEDAVKAAVVSKQLHTSGIKSVSNKDLQDLAARLDLERRVNQLEPAKVSAGQKIINNALTNPKKRKEYEQNVEVGTKVIKEITKLHKAKKVAAAVATAGVA